jgi:hypothetical protein
LQEAFDLEEVKEDMKGEHYLGVTYYPIKRAKDHFEKKRYKQLRVILECKNKEEGAICEMLAINMAINNKDKVARNNITNHHGGGYNPARYRESIKYIYIASKPFEILEEEEEEKATTYPLQDGNWKLKKRNEEIKKLFDDWKVHWQSVDETLNAGRKTTVTIAGITTHRENREYAYGRENLFNPMHILFQGTEKWEGNYQDFRHLEQGIHCLAMQDCDMAPILLNSHAGGEHIGEGRSEKSDFVVYCLTGKTTDNVAEMRIKRTQMRKEQQESDDDDDDLDEIEVADENTEQLPNNSFAHYITKELVAKRLDSWRLDKIISEKFVCSCQCRFATEGKRALHIKNMNLDKTFKCAKVDKYGVECPFAFKYKSGLIKHMKDFHKEQVVTVVEENLKNAKKIKPHPEGEVCDLKPMTPEDLKQQKKILANYKIKIGTSDLETMNVLQSGRKNDQKFSNLLLPYFFDSQVILASFYKIFFIKF